MIAVLRREPELFSYSTCSWLRKRWIVVPKHSQCHIRHEQTKLFACDYVITANQNNNCSRVKIDDILLQTEEQSAGEIAADSGICG